VTSSHDVWTDPELRDLLRSEPELVAIADALASAGGLGQATRRRRRAGVGRVGALAAALAAAAVVTLVAPWSRLGGDSLSSLALAAIGSEPVLHVVAELTMPTSAQLIEIDSGQARPVREERQLEIWYDPERGLKRAITRSGATVLDDILETPAGGFTPGGIVYDCAWIAAHPVEATKAGVSCDPSGDNGTTPRVLPRPKPTITPALAGFLDGYRRALAEGSARELGAGELQGRRVEWLSFVVAGGRSERVALDSRSHKAVLVEDSYGRQLRIKTIETLPTRDANFGPPTDERLGDEPVSVRGVSREALAPAPARLRDALPGALWAGPRLAGLPLATAERQRFRISFADQARAPETVAGLRLSYQLPTRGGRQDGSEYVEIKQARAREVGFWGFVGGDPPREGTLYAPTSADPTGSARTAFTVANGIYLTIRASTPELLLQAARLLRPT